MKDPIQKLYDQMTETQLDKARAHYKPLTRFRASESANCMRQIWHRLRGDRPAPRDAVGMMYGILGDLDHDITRDLLNQAGCTVGHVNYAGDGTGGVETLQTQKPYVVNLNGEEVEIIVSGRADGSMNTPKGRALLEIKGTGFWPYKYLNEAYEKDGQAGALKRVKEKHPTWYAQIQTSMAIFGYDLCYLIVKDRSTGTIGQVNRDTGVREGIYVPFDPEFFRQTLQRFAFVKTKLRGEQQGPKPEFAPKSKECSYCDFRWRCHGAAERRSKGLEPVYLYPGPQDAEHHDGKDDGSGTEREDAKR